MPTQPIEERRDAPARQRLRRLCVRGVSFLPSVTVATEFGPLHVFRPNRDVRFSSDETPYKTHCGAVTEGEGGEAFYLQISSSALMVASGYYGFAGDQIERFRTFAVAKWVHTPTALDRIVTTWRDAAELHHWLNRHVGSTTRAPTEW